MKLSRKILLVMFAIFIMLFVTAGASASGNLKQEYWVSNGFSGLNHAGSTWHAQTFVANSTYNVTGVEFQYFRWSATGNATVSIRSTNANGEPTGADLATSNPVNLGNLPDETPTTVYFDFNSPYLELTSGVKYAIIARVPDAIGIFTIGYTKDNGYPEGQAWQSFNSGGAWMWADASNMTDLLFRTYGEQDYQGAPSINIEKATNGHDADIAPGPYIMVGDPVTWTYVITNTGDVTLTNISVVDDQGVAVTAPGTELAPGESMTATGTGSATAGQYENIGTVTGEWGSYTVSDNDTSHYFGKIQIDVKPGSDKNPINLGSKGRTPVAILTTDAFDAATIDPSTVLCGPAEAKPVHFAFEDVDHDGDIDMILHFNTQELGLTEESTMVMLSGYTFEGVYVEGFDSIEIVPDKDKQDKEDNGNHKENAPGQNREKNNQGKGKETAPGQVKEDHSAAGGKGKETAPGQVKEDNTPAEGKGKETAPGQVKEDNAAAVGNGKETAPGQVKK